MATVLRRPLSASPNGTLIGVVATSSPGTTVHVMPTATNLNDGISLKVTNRATVWRILTVEWGTTSTNDQLIMSVPPQDGWYRIIGAQNWINQAASGATIAAFATATWGLAIMGYVNRRTD